jgi:hypothetical protein
MIRSQLILRRRDDTIMIKVPKESIPAYHFPQSAALVLKAEYSSLSFIKVSSFDKTNNFCSLRAASNTFLRDSAVRASQIQGKEVSYKTNNKSRHN